MSAAASSTDEVVGLALAAEAIDTMLEGPAEKPIEAKEVASIDAVVLPLNGHLVLNKPYNEDRTFLVHTLTREARPLPLGGDWIIEYDECGYAVVVDVEVSPGAVACVD